MLFCNQKGELKKIQQKSLFTATGTIYLLFLMSWLNLVPDSMLFTNIIVI